MQYSYVNCALHCILNFERNRNQRQDSEFFLEMLFRPELEQLVERRDKQTCNTTLQHNSKYSQMHLEL